jgi:hypothetical protein
MGGDKSANIEASSLLRWYAEVFRSAVCEPDARLMIIGYGFADPHINAHIRDGAAAGTKLFIIDPNGVDVIRNPQAVRSYNFGGSLDGALIGASRRNLLTTLISDSVERTKVMRFFS